MRLGSCHLSNLRPTDRQAPHGRGLRTTVQAMLYRSRRLETLLGNPLDTVDADLTALASKAEAAEAEGLDYKRESPAATDGQKAELG